MAIGGASLSGLWIMDFFIVCTHDNTLSEQDNYSRSNDKTFY